MEGWRPAAQPVSKYLSLCNVLNHRENLRSQVFLLPRQIIPAKYWRTKMRSGFIALAALLGMATTAHAQQILSGGTLYGGPAQVRAVCYIYNSGTTPLGLSGTQLADQNGTVQPLAINQCGS